MNFWQETELSTAGEENVFIKGRFLKGQQRCHWEKLKDEQVVKNIPNFLYHWLLVSETLISWKDSVSISYIDRIVCINTKERSFLECGDETPVHPSKSGEHFFLLILKKCPQKYQLKPSTAPHMKGPPHNQQQTDQLSDNFSVRSAATFLFLYQLKTRFNVHF